MDELPTHPLRGLKEWLCCLDPLLAVRKCPAIAIGRLIVGNIDS